MIHKRTVWIKAATALTDVVMVAFALYGAYLIRFDFNIGPVYWQQFVNLLPVFILIQITALYYFGGYRFIWRYTSLDDLINVMKALVCGVAVLAVVNYFRNYPLGLTVSFGFFLSSLFHRGYLHLSRRGRPRLLLLLTAVVVSLMLLAAGVISFTVLSSAPDTISEFRLGKYITSLDFRYALGMPRSIPILGGILSLILVGGIRLAPRLVAEVRRRQDQQGSRVLIYGAGDIGESIARTIRNQSKQHFMPVGFIDDDLAKQGASIHGVRVLGTRQDLASLADQFRVEELLLATLSIDSRSLKEIAATCLQKEMRLRRVPPLSQLISAHVNLASLEQVDTADLLGRSEVQLDPDKVRKYLRGKTVLVTGAGGSIGSELSRQISRCRPERLLLLGKGENSIYNIENELALAYPDLDISGIIGDVADADKMEFVFSECRPDVVFHAAAYKHVPLMESSPEESVRNNVFGTQTVAKAALQHGVAKFVLVSTDKAVHPSSVMGATKKLAESILQDLSDKGLTQFITVRFGNVLRSRGSVIPLFEKQIEAGGPVTVTHPEMTRYFMSIPEAVRLVLHAGAMGKGGDLCILDMGEPMRILDLAENMIRFAQKKPYDEIDIIFTGLRPGEKLAEELLTEKESAAARKVEKILICKAEDGDRADLEAQLERLKMAASRCRRRDIIDLLESMVPGYQQGRTIPEGKLGFKTAQTGS